MRKLIGIICGLMLSLSGLGQIQQDGVSSLLFYPELAPKVIQLLEINPKVESEKKSKEPAPFKFGENRKVDLSPNLEDWHTLPNGDRVLLWEINFPKAKSINLYFDVFTLGSGASMFIHQGDFKDRIGAFTAKNNKINNAFSTVPVLGSKVVVELTESKGNWGNSDLHLAQVTGAYQKMGKSFGESGSCNINVECPIGADFNNQKRSVILLLSNGNELCTGTLLNNTLQNGRPLVMTAEHCKNSNVNNWVFIFDYKSPNCSPNQDGNYDKSVSGGSVLAENDGQDMLLLEMSEEPPISYCVYYSGWDRSGSVPSGSTFGLHHPSGDVMKISETKTTLLKSDYFGGGGNNWWRVMAWDEGTTEGGSSGSGIFTEGGLFIGHLTGGNASCNSTSDPDFYSRLDTDWEGNFAGERVKDHLDPTNSGAGQISGWDPCDGTSGPDAANSGIAALNNYFCDQNQINASIKLINSGTDPITSATVSVSYNGQTSNLSWTGNAPVGGSMDIPVSFTYSQQNNNVTVEIKTINGANDATTVNNTWQKSFVWYPDGTPLFLKVVTDSWGTENSWVLKNDDGVILTSGGPYPDNVLKEYNTEICAGIDCYVFEFTDSYGDGMNEDGVGYYEMRTSNGTVVASGWNTPPVQNESVTESHTFCVNTISIPEFKTSRFQIFPNPIKDRHLHISADVAGEITLYTMNGKILGQYALAQGSNDLELDLSPGFYLVQISHKKGSSIFEKIIIE
ncbi:MAG: lysyl endopeptidase [Sphingobacteriales bacterium]|jgi:lysyl endopeptidase